MAPLYWLAIGLPLLLFVAPATCYLCAKMIVLGILTARRQFNHEPREKEKPNGDLTP